jgi:O-antigen ligase
MRSSPIKRLQPHPTQSLHVPRVDTREKIITALLAAWLIFQPWAFGTMHVWSQATAVTLAAAAFLLAILPHVTEVPHSGERIRVYPAKLIVRLPVFWLFLGLASYLVIQNLNPAWSYRASATHWWMTKVAPITWLPSGIDAPFDRMNGWRKLMIWASPFLAGCAAWLGVWHRRTARLLVVLIACNAVAVALFGIAQKYSGSGLIYWRFAFKADVFGCFVYRNHGAAYLIVALAALGGLALWHARRGIERHERSTPTPVIVFAALFLTVAIVYSGSRLGAAVAAFAIACLTVLTLRSFPQAFRHRTALIAIGLVIIGAAGTWSVFQLDRGDLAKRYSVLKDPFASDSLRGRIMGMELTREMIGDHAWTGVGAGGFKHLEPLYNSRYPMLTQWPDFWSDRDLTVHRYTLNDSHNDYLQLIAEIGILGAALALGLVAHAFSALWVRLRHPMTASVFVALVSVALYACVDFPVANPAVLGTLILLITVCCRWADAEPVRVAPRETS